MKKIERRAAGSRFPPRRAGSLMAKLALCRVSVAFKKASRPQEASMDDPPLDTKGKVTPVRGSRSTAPNTFRHT